MSKYYAVGSKVITEVVGGEKVKRSINVLIDNLPESRVEAVNAAKAIAKKEKINLNNSGTGEGVFIVKGTEYSGNTMTKYAKQRKAERGGNKKNK